MNTPNHPPRVWIGFLNKKASPAEYETFVAATERSNSLQNAYVPETSLLEAQSRIRELDEAIKSVLWLDRCRCDEAFTKRQKHENSCFTGELDPLREALAAKGTK